MSPENVGSLYIAIIAKNITKIVKHVEHSYGTQEIRVRLPAEIIFFVINLFSFSVY